MAALDIALPNQTIYINNLNDKLSKELLRRELYVICSQFGGVLDVVAVKNSKMRGQAFVVFQHLTSASAALSKLQGFNFYGKPMKTSYCKSKSDAVAKEEGTFVPKHKRKADGVVKGPAAKKAAAEEVSPAAPAASKQAAAEDKEEMEEDGEPPNKILFLERLPAEINENMLQALFKQFPGLSEVRMVPGKVGIAFVEFESEGQSSVAKDTLQGFKLTPTNSMKITFAKKM
jgi:U2 small nuclear ribonucleoprotein B''